MSLSPDNSPRLPGEDLGTQDTATAPPIPKTRTWQRRLLGICFAIFAFEVGLFLVIFPWLDDTWDVNYFQTLIPALQNLWDDPYFRGAVTGLGFVNIYIACLEVIRLLKRA